MNPHEAFRLYHDLTCGKLTPEEIREIRESEQLSSLVEEIAIRLAGPPTSEARRAVDHLTEERSFYKHSRNVSLRTSVAVAAGLVLMASLYALSQLSRDPRPELRSVAFELTVDSFRSSVSDLESGVAVRIDSPGRGTAFFLRSRDGKLSLLKGMLRLGTDSSFSLGSPLEGDVVYAIVVPNEGDSIRQVISNSTAKINLEGDLQESLGNCLAGHVEWMGLIEVWPK
ncbi:MAG: hypothetical protein AAFX06_19595 [Planctomycetota bacterium]